MSDDWKHVTWSGETSFTLYPASGQTHPRKPIINELIQKLLVFERKIVRGIFGPMKENQTRRIKNNEELDKLIKHENIVNYIKAQRLSWFG